MRRHLLALLFWGVAGAVSLSNAQYLTAAGGGVVAALEALPEGAYQTVGAATGGTTFDRQDNFAFVQFEHASGPYEGALDVTDGNALLAAIISWFYGTECAQCAVWGETGTSFDDFAEWSPAAWVFTPEMVAEEFSEPSLVQHFCESANGQQWRYAVTMYERYDSNGVFLEINYRRWIWMPSDTGWMQAGAGSSLGTVVEGLYTHSTRGINRHCTPPSLGDWFAGTYRELEAAPEPHPDVWGGFKTAWVEVQRKLARETAPFQLLQGVAWNPVPTSAQLGYVPDPGGGGGGGGDVIVEPGTCEDGWVLTRKVCEIWQFISYDAWVPEQDWGQRFGQLRDAAGAKFPFNLGQSLVFANHDNPENTLWQSNQACAPFVVHIGTGPLSNFPFPDNWSWSVPNGWIFNVDLCNEDILGPWRDVGRPLLFWVLFLTVSWRLLREVTGRA